LDETGQGIPVMNNGPPKPDSQGKRDVDMFSFYGQKDSQERGEDG